MPFTKQILKPINQCSLTGIEKMMYNCNHTYRTYQDSTGRVRMTFNHVKMVDGERVYTPVCGLFLQKLRANDYQILGVYTVPNERRRGFAKMLLASAKVRFKKVRHSENLTVQGRYWMNNVEGLTS